MKKKSHNQRKSLKKQFARSLALKENVVWYKPTPYVANIWFSRLNKLLFGNRLHGVEIRIKKLHHDWGRCVADWAFRYLFLVLEKCSHPHPYGNIFVGNCGEDEERRSPSQDDAPK